ncbi:MAG: YfcE family phosphodiesterase [Anaerolineae bacterium]|jgi:hypothetical protein
MRIVILSDIHDNVWHLAGVLTKVQNHDAMVCCGDLCSPFVVAQLGSAFGGYCHIVFGNNDGDRFTMARVAAELSRTTLHGELFEGELGGVRVAATHYPDIAHALAASGEYDLVCFGHTHELSVTEVGDTLLVNPGSVMGYDPAAREDAPATYMVFDAETRELEVFELVPYDETDGATGSEADA